MRILWIFGLATLLSACSSYSLRCNKHLRAINVPGRTASTSQPPASAASLAVGVAPGKP
jgi:hypothetical protein